MNKHNVIEHLLRLSMVLKLSHFNTKSEIIHKAIDELLNEINDPLDDLVEIYQSSLPQLIPFIINECTSVQDDNLLTLILSSKKYIEENKEGLDIYSINKIISRISKFIYKIKFLS